MSGNQNHDQIEEHKSLFQEITGLEQSISSNPESSFSTLQELRRILHEHFETEEEGGYLQMVLDVNPNLDPIVTELGLQHERLLRDIDQLLSELELDGRLKSEQQSRFHEWMKSLREHEAAENKLLLDTMNRDVGAED